MSNLKKLILFGTGDLAIIAKEYFSMGTDYQVYAFTVDRDYITGKEFDGLPVVPFEDIETHYPPEYYDMHVALIYNDMNRLRQKKCREGKDKRYDLVSYISQNAFVSPSAQIGENAFIFEDNTIQPHVKIGDNVILWSGNHVGHHSEIEDNVFISSHVVISGHCVIGANSFIGVNSTLANNTVIGRESWVMHGAIISGDIPPNSFVKTVPSDVTALNELALNRALERKKR
jgi:sugar O-acyltransferase (sialic acid O-acetyltransferase NeuD family)